MPFPVGAAIAGGATLAGAGINAGAQGKLNRKNREWQDDNWAKQTTWNEQMWAKQNQYNEGLWNKQNEYNEQLWRKMNAYNEQRWDIENQYNSPEAQMQRFKEAGLNPNLIYGQGNQGGSIMAANQETSPQRSDSANSASTGSWNPKAPNFDLASGILAYNNFREQSARTNNLEAQNNLIEAQVVQTLENTKKTSAETSKTGLEVQNYQRLIDTQVDALEANIQKTNVETNLALNKDEREAAMNSSNLREAAERIMNMRGQRLNQSLDSELKMMDIQLKTLGVQPHDPIWIRMLGKWFSNEKGNILDTFGGSK